MSKRLLGSVVALVALVASVSLGASAFACDLEADMAELGQLVGDRQFANNDPWFDLYSAQFSNVMMRANTGDMAGACKAMDDLIEWVHRNPPQSR